MKSQEFVRSRKRLGCTQNTLSCWLGVSGKAVQAYEQGWRAVPAHVERQVYVLLAAQRGRPTWVCWERRHCTAERRSGCPAFLFGPGLPCWLVTGTYCEGRPARSWAEKIEQCRRCEVFREAVDPPVVAASGPAEK